MMRARAVFFATLLASGVTSGLAHAQAKPVEKCTGNFEEAQLKERRGKLVEAEQLYAACADPTCPSMVRADCQAKHEDVVRRVPTITVAVRDASGKDVEATIELDGAPIEDRLHLRPIDPGPHVVRYTVAGQAPVEEKIAIVEGEKARVLTLQAVPAPSSRSNEKPGVPAKEAPSQPSVVGPVVLGGVGILLVATGVILQLNAISAQSDATDLREKAEDPSFSASDRQAYLSAWSSKHDSAKNNQTLAIVTGGLGLLAVAGGVTWYLVTRSSAKAAKETAIAPVTPVVAPGYAGAAFDVRF